ncbi:MAG: hypothetical protein JWM80_6455 [Cyanobacteria bacterium RYN_339]|nr:hypothetical protein [Cyanobacteria bacterium RYN_339]
MPGPDPQAPRLAPSLLDALPSPTPRPVLPPMPSPMVGPTLFHEDFEQGMGRWHASAGPGDAGWHLLRAAACGGLYTMVLGRDHNDVFTNVATTADLTLKMPLDLTRLRRPHLQYDLKGLCYPYDLLTIRPYARRPGGVWKPVGAAGQARYPLVVTFAADLTPFAGGLIELRFHGEMRAGSKPNRGLYLDDINVLETAR